MFFFFFSNNKQIYSTSCDGNIISKGYDQIVEHAIYRHLVAFIHYLLYLET